MHGMHGIDGSDGSEGLDGLDGFEGIGVTAFGHIIVFRSHATVSLISYHSYHSFIKYAVRPSLYCSSVYINPL